MIRLWCSYPQLLIYPNKVEQGQQLPSYLKPLDKHKNTTKIVLATPPGRTTETGHIQTNSCALFEDVLPPMPMIVREKIPRKPKSTDQAQKRAIVSPRGNIFGPTTTQPDQVDRQAQGKQARNLQQTLLGFLNLWNKKLLWKARDSSIWHQPVTSRTAFLKASPNSDKPPKAQFSTFQIPVTVSSQRTNEGSSQRTLKSF